ncbi:MAG: hypothetical protein A3F92_11275 [Candidatus Rokubacteria bacterium RIFCSPLOWO2_12_FULL_71_22]|nr:MAG: hypothetical protein A3F92_11275 [Candidatus Rokubacteria bacterium RIFCSPLOWO2_12_FULL_71_22]
MADRKYRQQGYRPQDAEPRRREPPAPDAPRRGGMLAQRTVSRCGACGAVLPIATATLEQCPHCRVPIHACRQCTHFDTGRRFECAEPIPERVADKNARNDCARFSLRVTVERNASPDSTRPGDIRRGFDNLFKK